jgi:anti-anti-sigma regulatory factor
MIKKRFKGTARKVEAANVLNPEMQEMLCAVIDAERSGEWMPAEELRDRAMTALAANTGMTLNVDRIDHLDASAMQILLAIEAEEMNLGHHLHLVNASPKLRQWFELSGAADRFFGDQRNADD